MIKRVNYHTHTSFCDGKNTIEELVVAAIEKNFAAIGFSGHSYTSFDERYCMSKEGSKEYKKQISEMKKKYGDRIQIFCGLELDLYSDADISGYDFLIGSVHYVKKNGIYYDVDESHEGFLKNIREAWNGDVYTFIEDYYATVERLAQKADIDIIGHIDLVTKFNENEALFSEKNERYIAAAKNAVRTLAKMNRPFEINTGAMYRGYRTTPYPSAMLLKIIKECGGSVVISSDCHEKNGLDFGYDIAEKMASDFGFVPITDINGKVK